MPEYTDYTWEDISDEGEEETVWEVTHVPSGHYVVVFEKPGRPGEFFYAGSDEPLSAYEVEAAVADFTSGRSATRSEVRFGPSPLGSLLRTLAEILRGSKED